MYLGIDLGTSGVKAVLIDAAQQLVAQGQAPLQVSYPQSLWSEQNPADWWQATDAAVQQIKAQAAPQLAAVRGIGLSGQMHGATLLDDRLEVLRPAILWNDGRSGAECRQLEQREPRLRAITGNLAMPGFTAPKLLWVAAHEPAVFKQVSKVLLPKDYLRLRLTGELVSEMSDAAGTLWLDVARRDWSDALLAACQLGREHMPRLVEGSAPSATLRPEIARLWGIADSAVVAGGAGDNAAGAVGMGVIAPGQAFLSLGTSGVYFVATAGFNPNPESAVHTFCHCLPATWHQMSVILSAASCLSWLKAMTGAASEGALLDELEATPTAASTPLFLPYLTGERTPHNNPHAQGVLFGLTQAQQRADLTRAILEGVAYALADGEAALRAAGTSIEQVALIGGGARSRRWGQILANVLQRPLNLHAGAEAGPAFGAARLGRLAASGEAVAAVCTAPPVSAVITPDSAEYHRHAERLAQFRRLYQNLGPEYEASAAGPGG